MTQSDFASRLKFNADGHIPAIIQDRATHRVLTLCYMTPEALQKTLEEKYVFVFRRSLGRLMKKGETSGHVQKVVEVSPDCEGKSILIEVEQQTAGCHKGYFSCYFESLDGAGELAVRETRVFDPKKVY